MKNAPLVIIRPRRKVHHGHHGGAWKVAYADFVTALMAFFLVMWLVGQDMSVRQAVAGYFRDPGAFDHAKSTSLLPGGDGLQPASKPGDKASLEQTASDIRRALGDVPELATIKNQIEVKVTDEGLRIEALGSTSSDFFDTGSAQMKSGAERAFAAIARELGRLPNDVMVEGHTDGRQYQNRVGYTNWELSADRANAVRRVMEQNGLKPSQVKEVRGFADTLLRNPEDPFDARNRRVSILVRHLKK